MSQRPAHAEAGDPLSVIAQTLQMQLYARRNRTDAMHMGAFTAVVALGLILLQTTPFWFVAGQCASLAVVTLVQIVLCAVCHVAQSVAGRLP